MRWLIPFVLLTIVSISIVSYQYVQIRDYQHNEFEDYVRASFPNFDRNCERLLEHEQACAQPGGLVTFLDRPEQMEFHYLGEPADLIEVIIEGEIAQSVSTGTYDDENRTRHRFMFRIEPDVEAQSPKRDASTGVPFYNATIVARPGNQSVTIPVMVVESFDELVEYRRSER